jgi:poly(3-hydroxybutyrate) depolymerase
MVFEQQTRCGPLRRRYLLRMPTGGTAGAPLLIVLNAAGQSAEQAPLETRWRFDDLAQHERAVLVYPNGSPSLKKDEDEPIHAGVWQIDDGAHPAVDDVAYLQAVVDDLRGRRGLDRAGDVFLAGYGSGAWMALAAAARRP